jgi:hypothetical protein
MQEFIARANIERFHKLIDEERDGESRDRLIRMLVEEQAKLRACETHPKAEPSQDQGGGGSERQ